MKHTTARLSREQLATRTAGRGRPVARPVQRVHDENDAQLRVIIDSLPGGFTYQNVAHPDGTVRYTYISAGVERLLGLTPERVLADAHAFLELVVDEDRPRVAALERQALHDAGPFDCEFRWRTVIGEVKWVHCRSTAHRLDDGSIIWNGVITDVTARRQAETEAAAQQIRLSLAQEAAGMVTWEWDILIGSIRYSDNVRALRGEAVASCSSLDQLMTQFHPEDRERVMQTLEQAVNDGRAFECEYRLRMPDGAYRWFLGKGKPVAGAGGKPVRVVGLSVDITVRKEAEQNLRRSEALYRAIGESIDYGVWVCAPDGRNLYASDSFLKLVGLTQEQCSSFGWINALHPEEAERAVAAWKECVQAGGKWDREHRFRGIDGEYHPILARGVPVKNARGEVICWAGINLDISRLKGAQEALRASEARFRLLSDTGRRLLATPDPQGLVYPLCRDVMAHLDCQMFFNYLAEQAPGPAAAERPAGDAELRLHLNACSGISEEQARQVEWLDYGAAVCGCVARDGRCLVAEDVQHSEDPRTRLVRSYGVQAYCCHPLLVQGRVIGTLSFGTTTRPRFTAEEVELMRAIADEVAVAMRRLNTLRALDAARAEANSERNRLAAVMETLPVGVAILDAEGKLVRANPAYDQLWSGTPQAVRGGSDYARSPAWLADSGKPIQPEEWAGARAVRRGETVLNQELQIQRLDGTRAFVLNSAAPIRDALGRVAGCVEAIRDISERKQAEELRRQLELQMQQAQKEESLGVLAGGIAHDFNNLLTVVLGNLGLVSTDAPAGSPARPALAKAEQAARHAADLCQQMLAYAGKTPLAFRPIQLNRLLQDMVHLMTASLSGHAQLRWQLADPLPAVQADAAQLRQVVMNLLINASEAIGDRPGCITFATGSAHCAPADLLSPWQSEPLPEGHYVFLEVADTGCGIDAEKLSRVFEPFFSTKFTGRGLGLATVLGIVRSHHGTIQVRSTPGSGSAFRVWLPALQGEPDAAATVDAPAPPWRGSGTILLVDDEEAIRSTTKELLGLLGFETVTAADGLEAVEIFRANPERFWCVLLDATMPQLNGEETWRELARIRPNVRVVLMSGYSKDDILGRFESRALSGFLQKPYTLANLTAVLRSVSQAAA